MPTYIIDGYNAIYKIPKAKAQLNSSLEKARNILIDIVAELDGASTIVFDGKTDAHYGSQSSIRGVRIIFTDTNEEADDRIADILRHSDSVRNMVVVSDDNRVANSARAFKAKPAPVNILLKRGTKKTRNSNIVGPCHGMASNEPTQKGSRAVLDSITRELIAKWIKKTRA